MEKSIVEIDGILHSLEAKTAKNGNTFLIMKVDDGSGINKKIMVFGENVNFYLETAQAGKKLNLRAEEQHHEKFGTSYIVVQADSEAYLKWRKKGKQQAPKSKGLDEFLDAIPYNIEKGFVPMFDFKNGNTIFWHESSDNCIKVGEIIFFGTTYPKYQKNIDFIMDHVAPLAVTEYLKEKATDNQNREWFLACLEDLTALAFDARKEKEKSPLYEFEKLLKDDDDPGDLF